MVYIGFPDWGKYARIFPSSQAEKEKKNQNAAQQAEYHTYNQ